MSNNVNKRPFCCLIFISLLSLLLQISWHTKYWSQLLYGNNIHYNNNDDGIGDTSFNLDRPYSRQVPIQRNRKRKRIKLIHVMNTYTITNNKNGNRKVQPFDQWSTIKSIERALEQNNNSIIPLVDKDGSNSEIEFILDVDFVCAIFESDIQYLQHLPCRKVMLNRSTKTEYTTAEKDNNEEEDYLRHFINIGHGNNSVVVKELPFLQDIIDSTISDYYKQQQNSSSDEAAATSTTATADDDNDIDIDVDNDDDIDDFYIMLTNSDIGVTKDFYTEFLLPKLVHKNSTTAALALALSINRLTIPMTKQLKTISDKYNDYDNSNNNNYDDNDELLLTIIDDTLQSNNGLISHPGYDCFIIHSSILKKINLGNMFAGYPPWGSISHFILKIMTSSSQSSDYINYKSSPQATLTDTTTSINNNDYDNDNNDNVDTDEIIRIPNFVQSGYEEIYLKSKYYNSKSMKVAGSNPAYVRHDPHFI
ncbi:hypothetical protein FRACYDRAFT_241017 [Fragilariopsis cylindrus CCMP1102]|uniref:Uncharacterized protein n=1 Tax=Fragilariopsis cylindrus CCMP1102 TaxID=635003 RepID=A0A1E7F8H4_9STRA|nr:hypothetical protein FRACYDRAFT_241017 [Fragilariopsis cylindrus CCMP1102]|eukprot:OEU14472.1 hypothetical protein FRACYDRAFT_241017 [Fragilariopsis cylindrus CCMP1102]